MARARGETTGAQGETTCLQGDSDCTGCVSPEGKTQRYTDGLRGEKRIGTGDGKNRTKLIEWITVVGVIASLVFVGVQIRQNTSAIRAASYQAQADQSMTINLNRFDEDFRIYMDSIVRSSR